MDKNMHLEDVKKGKVTLDLRKTQDLERGSDTDSSSSTDSSTEN